MNSNNFNTNIEDLFRDFSETPSSNCWDAISQKLDVVLPVNAPNVASNPSSFSKFFSSAIGKSVAIITSAVVVGVTVFAVLKLNDTPKTEAPVTINNLVQEQPSEINQEKISTKEILPKEKSIPIVVSTEVADKQVATTPEKLVSPTNPTISPVAINTVPASIQPVTVKSTPVSAEIAPSDEVIEEETVVVNNTTVEPKANVVAEVKTKSNLVFPNVFTPNGDGFNDLFVIKNIDESSNNRLVIVNANGVKVFEANNYQNNWDAINVPVGAYFYVFETKVDGVSQSFYGNIQIIR